MTIKKKDAVVFPDHLDDTKVVPVFPILSNVPFWAGTMHARKGLRLQEYVRRPETETTTR